MSAICVADVNAGAGVSRGVWSSSLPCEGNAALLIVNLGQVRTLAQLNSALAALPIYPASDYFGRTSGTRPPAQSGIGPGILSTGPFAPPSNPQPNPQVLAFSYKAGWTAANVSATMRPYVMGSIGGPHAVALIVDHEQPGSDAARGALVAGAVAALTGVLS
ncbi:hypothetical protein [Roseateles sp. LYH14W]|uniref:Uncharacterized protein n=1 Tax=Pelomonas parva TaxID=3299032 RepID=A0ABW7EVM1_9BURK